MMKSPHMAKARHIHRGFHDFAIVINFFLLFRFGRGGAGRSNSAPPQPIFFIAPGYENRGMNPDPDLILISIFEILAIIY